MNDWKVNDRWMSDSCIQWMTSSRYKRLDNTRVEMSIDFDDGEISVYPFSRKIDSRVEFNYKVDNYPGIDKKDFNNLSTKEDIVSYVQCIANDICKKFCKEG